VTCHFPLPRCFLGSITESRTKCALLTSRIIFCNLHSQYQPCTSGHIPVAINSSHRQSSQQIASSIPHCSPVTVRKEQRQVSSSITCSAPMTSSTTLSRQAIVMTVCTHALDVVSQWPICRLIQWPIGTLIYPRRVPVNDLISCCILLTVS